LGLNLTLFTATEYSLIWRMLDLLGFPGLALYLILGKTAVLPEALFVHAQLLCIEHDNHYPEMIQSASRFGFKAIAINPENLILAT